jgi:hypothetical protein
MRFGSFGLAAFAAVACLRAGAFGSALLGCSSSTAGAADAGAPPETSGGDAGAPVGAQCASSSDCPSGEQCSNAVYSAGNPIYPTPICVAPCTAQASTSQGLASCGSASLPGAGLCEPPSGGGAGLCLPYCQVTPSGTVVGCQANDVCQVLGSNGPEGAGWCQPGCTASTQCPSGSVCDPLLAACVANPLVATLSIGAVCSLTANPAPCNCVGTQTATEGYCTAACVTGATVCASPPLDGGAGPAADGGDAGAPAGEVPWVCTAGLNFVTDADGGAIFKVQPPGLFGFCAPSCNTDADCTSIKGHCTSGDPAAAAGFTGTCVTGP